MTIKISKDDTDLTLSRLLLWHYTSVACTKTERSKYIDYFISTKTERITLYEDVVNTVQVDIGLQFYDENMFTTYMGLLDMEKYVQVKFWLTKESNVTYPINPYNGKLMTQLPGVTYSVIKPASLIYPDILTSSLIFEIPFITSYGWNEMFCGNFHIIIELTSLYTNASDVQLLNNTVMLPANVVCKGDLFQVTKGELQTLYPIRYLYTDVPQTVNLVMEIESTNSSLDIVELLTVGGKLLSTFDAYISVDPFLNTFLDDVVSLDIMNATHTQDSCCTNRTTVSIDAVITIPKKACRIYPVYLIILAQGPLAIRESETQSGNNYLSLPIDKGELLSCDVFDENDLKLAISNIHILEVTGHPLFVATRYNFTVTVSFNKINVATQNMASELPNLNLNLYISKPGTLQNRLKLADGHLHSFIPKTELIKVTNLLVSEVKLTGEIVLPMDLMTESWKFCGSVNIIAILDEMSVYSDKDRSNNVLTLPLVLGCPDDALSVSDVNIHKSIQTTDVTLVGKHFNNSISQNSLILKSGYNEAVNINLTLWNTEDAALSNFQILFDVLSLSLVSNTTDPAHLLKINVTHSPIYIPSGGNHAVQLSGTMLAQPELCSVLHLTNQLHFHQDFGLVARNISWNILVLISSREDLITYNNQFTIITDILCDGYPDIAVPSLPNKGEFTMEQRYGADALLFHTNHTFMLQFDLNLFQGSLIRICPDIPSKNVTDVNSNISEDVNAYTTETPTDTTKTSAYDTTDTSTGSEDSSDVYETYDDIPDQTENTDKYNSSIENSNNLNNIENLNAINSLSTSEYTKESHTTTTKPATIPTTSNEPETTTPLNEVLGVPRFIRSVQYIEEATTTNSSSSQEVNKTTTRVNLCSVNTTLVNIHHFKIMFGLFLKLPSTTGPIQTSVYKTEVVELDDLNLTMLNETSVSAYFVMHNVSFDSNLHFHLCSNEDQLVNVGVLVNMVYAENNMGIVYEHDTTLNTAYLSAKLGNCPSDTRVYIDEFSLNNNALVVHVPSSVPYKLGTTIYNTAAFTQNSKLKIYFHLYNEMKNQSQLQLHNVFSTARYFGLMTNNTCLKLNQTLTANQQAAVSTDLYQRIVKVDISDINVGLNFKLDSQLYRFCWKVVTLHVLVYSELGERSPKDNSFVLNTHKSYSNSTFYLECGSQGLDQCSTEFHKCKAPAVCRNLYNGYECLCADVNKLADQNGYCVDTKYCLLQNGSSYGMHFKCNASCPSGYKYINGVCDEINECRTISVCHHKAQCYNTPGSYICTCSEGYSGDGKTCYDIKNCTETSCKGGICQEQDPGYRCYCNGTSVSSDSCTTQLIQWSSWSNFTKCSTFCGLGVQQRSRICKQEGEARNNSLCQGPSIDTVSCVSQSCEAAQADICANKSNRCDQQRNRGVCYRDTPDTYKCECIPPLEAIISNETLQQCGHNTLNSSIIIETQNMTTVTHPPQDQLFWIDETSLSKCLKQQSNSSTLFMEQKLPFPIPISTEGNVENIRYIYVAPNGIIVLANKSISLPNAQLLQNPSHLLYFSFLKDFGTLVAPLWLRASVNFTNPNSDVCIEVFNKFSSTNDSIFHNVDRYISTNTNSNFSALLISTATWQNIFPKWDAEYSYQTNTSTNELTFQLNLVTDYKEIFAIFSYKKMKLTTKASISETNSASGPAVFQGFVNSIGQKSHNLRYTIKDSGVVYDMKPVFNISSLEHTTTLTNITHSKSNEAVTRCIQWASTQQTRDSINISQSCPPTLARVVLEPLVWTITEHWSVSKSFEAYLWMKNTTEIEEMKRISGWKSRISTHTDGPLHCYTRVVPDTNGWNVDCCYLEKQGLLVSNIDQWHLSGFTRKINNKDNVIYFENDLLPLLDCCALTTVTDQICPIYSQRRPLPGSSQHTVVGLAYGGGDPSLRTLDGALVRINIPGHFVAVDSTSFSLHASVDSRSVNNKQVLVITRLIAGLAQGVDGLVEIDLFAKGLLNFTVVGISFFDHAIHTKDGTIISGTEVYSQLDFTFRKLITLSVRAVENSVVFLLQLPFSFQGNTKGLLGNFDSDPQNDFITSLGIPLPTVTTSNGDVTLETKYLEDQFTESWMVPVLVHSKGVVSNISMVTSQSQLVYPTTLIYPTQHTSNNSTVCQNFTETAFASLVCESSLRTSGSALFAAASGEAITNLVKQTAEESNTGSQAVLKCADVLVTYAGEVSTMECVLEVEAVYQASLHLTNQSAGNLNLTSSVFGVISYNFSLDLTSDVFDSSPFQMSTLSKEPILGLSMLPTTLRNPIKFEAFTTLADSEPDLVATHVQKLIFCPCLLKEQCNTNNTYLIHNTEDLSFEGDWLSIAECECPPWKDGLICQFDINPCDYHPCFADVTCTFNTTINNYTCGECPNGMRGDGVDCYANLCENYNSTYGLNCEYRCVIKDDTPTCECPQGFRINSDNITCSDINECEAYFSSCSQPYFTCINNPGSYQCGCQSGFQLENEKCIDIDECLVGDSNCSLRCINTAGSYICSCYSGFELDTDGRTCMDIDECKNAHPCSHTCHNTIGLYTCSCNEGFVLDTDRRDCIPEKSCSPEVLETFCNFPHASCSNSSGAASCGCESGYKYVATFFTKRCDNINECISSTKICPEGSECLDSDGSYFCQCMDGYQAIDGGGGCENVNECQVDNGGCDHICSDVIGSYLCKCWKGYVLKDGTTCEDIDECSLTQSVYCDANAACINQPGSFECYCNKGYIGNGLTCVDVNECSYNNGGCQFLCENKPGGVECSCPLGYLKEKNGKSCRDVNECARSELHTCRGTALCRNFVPGFTCYCPEGYQTTSNTSTTMCEPTVELTSKLSSDNLAKQQCKLCDHGCSLTPNSAGLHDVICLCPLGFTLEEDKVTCIDVNECQTKDLCGENSICDNTHGSFTCNCTSDIFIPDKDGLACTENRGNWSPWSDFSPCTVQCDYTYRSRHRLCNNPPPSSEGSPCVGSSVEYTLCAEVNCEVDLPEEINSVEVILSPTTMLHWLKDVREGFSMWLTNSVDQFCQENFTLCCGHSASASQNILSGHFAVFRDPVVSSYPREVQGGVRLKVTAHWNPLNDFCRVKSPATARTSNIHTENVPTVQYVKPDILLMALEYGNASKSNNNIFETSLIMSLHLGMPRPVPSVFELPVILAVITMCIIFASVLIYVLIKSIRTVSMSETETLASRPVSRLSTSSKSENKEHFFH
ncbi:uncharacterized protein LOC100182773 [Ciona intestinalis]